MRERDLKYREVLGHLNRQLAAAKRENLQLKNGNHRLKIKYATSRVGDMLRKKRSQSSPSLAENVSLQNSRYRKIIRILLSKSD